MNVLKHLGSIQIQDPKLSLIRTVLFWVGLGFAFLTIIVALLSLFDVLDLPIETTTTSVLMFLCMFGYHYIEVREKRTRHQQQGFATPFPAEPIEIIMWVFVPLICVVSLTASILRFSFSHDLFEALDLAAVVTALFVFWGAVGFDMKHRRRQGRLGRLG
ncbi:MAG: hypothetical protein Q4G30_08230 [Actinomycetaceae bacterium]|nr:hypothetical protein [Actinomycetaceae bacterium]